VDIQVLRVARSPLPGIMPSTGCAQEKVFACEAVHNGRKLSTLGISRTTLHLLITPRRAAGRAGPGETACKRPGKPGRASCVRARNTRPRGAAGCARLPDGRSPHSLAFEHVFDERGSARPDLPGYRRARRVIGRCRRCRRRGGSSRSRGRHGGGGGQHSGCEGQHGGSRGQHARGGSRASRRTGRRRHRPAGSDLGNGRRRRSRTRETPSWLPIRNRIIARYRR
jgi:hypothetical protein